MPSKRDILALLTRDELVSIVDAFELGPSSRKTKDALVEAIASSRKATPAEFLPVLEKDSLKRLCQELELEISGAKPALVERLLSGKSSRGDSPPSNGKQLSPGKSARTDTSPPSSSNGKRPSKVPAQASDDVDPSEVLTREKLEGYLWSAADILRGSIDSSDYKNYILGMLFLKRLSDRFEEECEALAGVPGANPDDPDEHAFYVPTRARWGVIQKTATNIGDVLNKACAALEDRNPRELEGVLGGIDYNDERRLGDNRNRDNVLSRLVQHFSKVKLRNANLSEPDILGRAYEYLIERFADDAGKKGGEFYTPKKVVELIVALLDPKQGMRICDPTAGSAGMLIACAHHVQNKGGDPRNLSLYGQEKNLGTWALSKMNLLLHNLPGARIEKGDTIRDPRLVQSGELMLFDRVIANPPFSLDDWGRDVTEQDPHGRFRFGIPPKTKGDLAFVQHMIATTNKTGMVGVVMPHGVLFRGAAEGEIRRGILEEDLVEAVIGLPPNLFYGTGIPAAILVLNREKKPAHRKKVLFVEASREFREGSAQNYLRDEDVKKIAATFHTFKDVDKYARIVALDEIEKNDWNLNISRYVETAEAAEKVDVAAAIAKLRELEKKRSEAEVTMNRYLRELGYDS